MARKTDIDVRLRGDASSLEDAINRRANKAIGAFAKSTQNAARQISSSFINVRGLIAGVATAVSGRAIIAATIEQERVTKQLEATLRSTKQAAGLTRDELLGMAAGLQQVTTYGDEAIIPAQSMLLTFTQIGRDVFPVAIERILDMSTALGQDLKGATLQVGKALNDPIKGVSALAEAGIQFTEQQKALIKQLVETNRVADAQKIILAELEVQFGGSARAARDTLGGAIQSAKNAFGDLLEGDGGSVSDATDAFKTLTETLTDPSVKAGFAVMVQGLAQILNLSARATSNLAGLSKFVGEEIGSRAQGPAIDDPVRIEQAIERAQERLKFLEGRTVLFGREAARREVEAARAELARLQALQRQAAELQRPAPVSPAKPDAGTAPPLPTLVDPDAAKKAAAAAKARAQAVASAEASVFAAELARAQAQLEDSYQRRLITAEQYYAEKRDLELLAIDREIEARQAALARANEAERISIEGEIEALRIKRVAAAEQLARDEAQAYREERERQQTETLEQLQREIDATFERVYLAEQRIAQEVTAGLTSQRDARQQIVEANREAAESLDALIARYELLVAASGDPALAQNLERLKLQLGDLRMVGDAELKALGDAIQGNIGGGIAAALDDIRNIEDAFENMLKSILSSVNRYIGDELASMFTDFLKNVGKSAGGGAGGEGGGFLASIGSFFANLFHSGGVVGGAAPQRRVPLAAFIDAPRYHGGGIAGLAPDEVPAILKRGERVQTAEQARAADARMAPVVVHISATDARSFQQNQTQIAATIGSAIDQARRRYRT